MIEQYFDNLTAIMNDNLTPNETWYGIQMGLWFYDIKGNTFDCDIMNGKYDDHIDAMIKGFNKLGRPVWLRIGYEFNGQWTYFTETCYIGAYQRITKALRADEFCNKSCATVWDYTADSEYVGMYTILCHFAYNIYTKMNHITRINYIYNRHIYAMVSWR